MNKNFEYYLEMAKPKQTIVDADPKTPLMDIFVTTTFSEVKLPESVWDKYINDADQQAVINYLNANHKKNSHSSIKYEELEDE